MMSTQSVPAWGIDGLIPPIDPGNPVGRTRSPYQVTLQDFVVRFGGSSERLNLLEGLLRFRAMWHQAGLTKGFQWINGSFVEDKETVAGSPPADIDIVTFFELPQGFTQIDLFEKHGALFQQENIKASFSIDAYFVVLEHTNLELLIENAVYWYSLFAHTRQDQWKGYVEIDLAEQNDTNVSRDIASILNGGGQSGS